MSTHPSAQFLPAGEIDNRINRSSEEVKGEFRESMKNIEDKVDNMAEKLTLLTGTSQTPGVLSRIEESLALVVGHQARSHETQQERIIADDRFRDQTLRDLREVKREVETLKKEVAVFKMIITVGGAFLRGAKKVTESTWTVKAIFALISWMFGVQMIHTVWPMIRESIKHHKFMY